MPGMHKSLLLSLALHKPGVMAHIPVIHWEVEVENQKLKVILVHSELKASLRYKRQKERGGEGREEKCLVYSEYHKYC